MVTTHEQSYEDALMGYYCKAPLLTVGNRWCIEQIIYCIEKNVFVVFGNWSFSPLFFLMQIRAGICQQFAE